MLTDIDWQDISASGKDKDVKRTYGMFHNKYLEINNMFSNKKRKYCLEKMPETTVDNPSTY